MVLIIKYLNLSHDKNIWGLPQIVDRENRRQVKSSTSQKQNFLTCPKRRQFF